MKKVEYKIRKAKEEEFIQVRKLQIANQSKNVDKKYKKKEGYVTIETKVPLLKKINKKLGVLVAVADSKVIGYEIPLDTKDYKMIHWLISYVEEKLYEIEYQGKKLIDYKTVIDVQLCVDKNYKGLGIAEALHKKFVKMLKGKYEIIVTGIAEDNPRSFHVATTKLGMNVINKYISNGKTFYVLI